MTLEAGRTVVAAYVKHNRQWAQWLSTLVASISFFTTGIFFAWSSPSLVILQSPETPFETSNDQASWIASLMTFGSVFGPILGAMTTRFLGPKQCVLSSSIPFLIGFLLIIFATNPVYLYVSRFISGVGVGFVFTSVPLYIGEISEDHNRGSLMISGTQMMSLGSILMTCIGPYVSIQTAAEIFCIFPLFILAVLPFMPDSPHYLIRVGKDAEAAKAIKWLRREKNDVAAQGIMESMKKNIHENAPFLECLKCIKDKPNPKALLIVLMTILAQQFSGAIAVAFYMEQIFISANIPLRSDLAVIITQSIGLVVGLLTLFLVDRVGRRPLLLVSSIGCGASTALLGIYFEFFTSQTSHPAFKWLPVVALIMFTISANIGLAPLPYTILSEVFPSNFKEVAVCLISVIGAFLGFTVAKCFQIFNDMFGSTFVFFGLSALTLVVLVINIFILPETAKKSLAEIQTMLIGPEKNKNKSTNM